MGRVHTHVAILSKVMASLSYTENCLSDIYSSFLFIKQVARLKYRKPLLCGYKAMQKEKVKPIGFTLKYHCLIRFTGTSVNQHSNCNLGSSHF